MKSCPTSAVLGALLFLSTGTPLFDHFPYRSTVGAVQYLTNIRPDIAFIVNKLSQFLKAPTDVHWSTVKCVLRYLASTLDHGLTIKPDFNFNITAYSDADWASGLDDRKSTVAYYIYLGYTLISWSFKKQLTMARSSTQSEYKALAHAAVEITWVRNLLSEIGFSSTGVPVLRCDNMGAGALAANPVFHVRTKHIEIDVHFVWDLVLQGQLHVRYVPSIEQLIDCLPRLFPTNGFLIFEASSV
ncbi:secreted RxLR effector protein 161-like [Benincasa hispida]|uniref:secreted RxLR effector protein 161-like n=1 Tax=Benincasa hispida TaxID=102211 RepID=UPI0018FF4403|nr:secreted RxLR effector protein 161-like [Benincasa hispida]